MAAEPDASTADGEWVFHEGDGPWSGWLYRYTDGTLVTEDGTVLEPAADDAPAPAADHPPPAVEEVAPAPAPEHPPPVVEEVAAAPAAEQAPSVVEEVAQRPSRDPATDETTAPTDDHPPPVVEEVAQRPSRDPATDETTAPTDDHPATTPPVPAYLRWDSSALPQYLLGGVFVVGSLGAVLLLIAFVARSDPANLVTAAGLGLLAAAALWGMDRLAPTSVTVREAVVTVARGGREKAFDLGDDHTEVDLRGKPGTPSWQARLRSVDGEAEVLRRSHVQPVVFTEVVEHHLAARERSGA